MIDFDDLTNDEKEALARQVENWRANVNYNNNVDAINRHKRYVGQAFRDGSRYIYVLSAKSSNALNMECMVFDLDEVPQESDYTDFHTKSTDAFSEIIYEGIHIEDYPMFVLRGDKLEIERLEPISNKLYYSAYDLFTEKLKSMMNTGVFNTSKGEISHR